jgi:hypothetical protein
LSNESYCQGRFAASRRPDQKKSGSICAGKPRRMKAIDAQWSKKLKQTKTPEVALRQFGLG